MAASVACGFRRTRGTEKSLFLQADDFIILGSVSSQDSVAVFEKFETLLHNGMGAMLAHVKTRITQLTRGFEFLGHRVRMPWYEQYSSGN